MSKRKTQAERILERQIEAFHAEDAILEQTILTTRARQDQLHKSIATLEAELQRLGEGRLGERPAYDQYSPVPEDIRRKLISGV